MLEKIKSWIFDDNEFDGEKIGETVGMVCAEYKINEFKELKNIADSMKENNIVLIYIDEKVLIRVLDFISGMNYVFDFQVIKINKTVYLFLPHQINYKPNS